MARSKYLSSFSPSFTFICSLLAQKNPPHDWFSSFYKLKLVFLPGLCNPVVSQSPREFYGFHFQEQILTDFAGDVDELSKFNAVAQAKGRDPVVSQAKGEIH